ncbi:hypothetical protein HOY80DRAFT_743312 [Tuber brumale]|nr:hypothetical protein HOY80DRAFT_743312 [Tuber brumale]
MRSAEFQVGLWVAMVSHPSPRQVRSPTMEGELHHYIWLVYSLSFSSSLPLFFFLPLVSLFCSFPPVPTIPSLLDYLFRSAPLPLYPISALWTPVHPSFYHSQHSLRWLLPSKYSVMHAIYHPSRRKCAILYHLLAIGSFLLPQVTCQFMFPALPATADIFTTQTQCRGFYNECMETFRACVRVAGPNDSIKSTCENWRSRVCEDMIRMGCDGLPNERHPGNGGTLGGGTKGMGVTSSNQTFSVPTSSNARTLKSTSTDSPPLTQPISPQPTQISDPASPTLTLPIPTPTQVFPLPTTPPIIPPTPFSSFSTILITSTITTTQTFTAGTSTWTATMTRTMTTTERRGLNFTVISNDSARPWCRTGVGISLLSFWSVVGWAGCLV